MDETQPVAQEGSYPVREQEHEVIQGMLQQGIDSDRHVFAVIRDRLPAIAGEVLAKRKAIANAS